MSKILKVIVKNLIVTRTDIALTYLGIISLILCIFFALPGFRSPGFQALASNYVWSFIYLISSAVTLIASAGKNRLFLTFAAYINCILWGSTVLTFYPSFIITWGGGIATATLLLSVWFMIKSSVIDLSSEDTKRKSE